MHRRRALFLATIGTVLCLVVMDPVAASAADRPPGSGGARSTSTSTVPATAAPTAGVPAAPAATDVLNADRDAVRARVADVDSQIRSAEADAAEAQDRVAAAEAAAATASERSARAGRSADDAAAAARAYAIEAFVHPPAQDALSAMELSEATDAAYASGVLKIVAEQRRQVVDTMIAARAVADQDRSAASAAAGAARAEVEQARAQVSALQTARAEQSQLASQLDDRLSSALAEAAALRRVDAGVADDLAAQEVALRTAGPSSPADAARPKATTVAAPPTTSPNTGTSTPRPSGGSPTTVQPTTPRPPTTTPPVTSPGLVTWSDVVKVGGIWVNKSIASNVAALVDAARAAGINLGGGGYRDPAGQIAVRIANCGASDYAIYQMPASQCSPPTARPGTSMHERGLAMDLQSSGHLITSRSDPAFAWLNANAARFGFYNLPSEPWHWSTNGS